MTTITLFEHGDPEPFDALGAFDMIRHPAMLEALNKAAGTEVLRLVFRHGKPCLAATEQVGVLRFGAHTVQVLPKIYRRESTNAEDCAHEATRNLLHMLAVAQHLPMREQEVAPLLRRHLDWFEILTRLFASHLLVEWQRGADRSYQVRSDDLALLRGKLDVPEHLRRPGRRHILPVFYDEFTADNDLNRVFRFVTERLYVLAADTTNRQQLGLLRLLMEDVTLIPRVTLADAARIHLSRLNRRFEPLLNLARLFLASSTLQLAAGQYQVFSFVFDMNALFEAFVVNLILRYREQILPEGLRSCHLLPQARHATQYLARREGGEKLFLLKPDLAFRSGDTFPILLDLKYKRLDAAAQRLGIAQDDFYQMFVYSHCYECPCVLMIYPRTADMSEMPRGRFELLGTDRVVRVETLDLQIAMDTESDRHKLIDGLKEIFGELP